MSQSNGVKIPTNSGVELWVRPVAANDERQIVSLFNAAFSERDLPRFTSAEWQWKYLNNPAATPELSIVAVDASGRIVAHGGAWPFRLNLLGRPSRIAQWLDGMVLPQYQRQGIVTRMFPPYIQSIEAAGFRASFSMPNQNSIVWHQPRSTFLFLMNQRELALNSTGHEELSIWNEGLKKDGHLAFEFNPACALDHLLDKMLATSRSREFISIWKDSEHYKWKYVRSPRSGLYRFFSLEKRGLACAAFAVVREYKDRADLLEIHSQNKDVSLARELVLRIADHFSTQQNAIDKVRFVGKDQWYFDAVFHEFDWKRSFSYSVFCRASSSSERFIFENPANWTITWSDADEI